VEAPTETNQSDQQVVELAPFTPSVTFSNLGVAGSQAALYQNTLYQGNSPVAQPSALASDAFSVNYTGP